MGDQGRGAEGIVLYDGECNLCAAIVQFTIKRDRRGRLKYAALQSGSGRRLLAEHGLDPGEWDTFVYVEKGKAYVRSTAALRLVRRLGGAWPLLSVLLAIPRPLRDPLYTFVARNRYRWFGRRTQCMLMRPEYKERFLP